MDATWKDSKGRSWRAVARRAFRVEHYDVSPWRCPRCDMVVMSSFETTISTRLFATPASASYEVNVRCNRRFEFLLERHQRRPCPPRMPDLAKETKRDEHLQELIASWRERASIVLLKSAAAARCLECPHQFLTTVERSFRTRRVSYERADRTLDTINYATLYGQFLEHRRDEHGKPPHALERAWLRQLQEEANLE